MHNLRRTLEQRWSFQQATVMCFIDWVKVSSELAQDRRAWNASVRDVVKLIGDTGSTRPG